MSNPIPREQMRKALLDKGFVDKNDGDHTFYYFYHKGKKTIARTKISRGSGYKTYNDTLFTKMKTQLQLDSIQQVRALLECPMSEQDFVLELKKRNLLDD